MGSILERGTNPDVEHLGYVLSLKRNDSKYCNILPTVYLRVL